MASRVINTHAKGKQPQNKEDKNMRAIDKNNLDGQYGETAVEIP